MTFARFTVPALMLVLSACAPDVGEGRVAATVSAPAPTTEVADAPTGRVLTLDASASTVRALGAKITATHPIEFDRWEGQLRAEGAELTSVEVTIHMDSLRADIEDLTEHLKKADFFDVETFPTARFASTTIVAKPGADGATHEVTGNLTMHGQTLRLTFPATVSEAEGALKASTEFVIDRQDFGIAYPGMPDDLIQDSVALTIELVGR
jgi:polyisoprenoid-binding protein YceI